MSNIPLSLKVPHQVSSLSATNFYRPTSSVAYSTATSEIRPVSQGGNILNESNIATRQFSVGGTAIQSSLVGSNGFNDKLRDIKRRYEDEAKYVQQNYQVDFNNHVNLVKNIEDLESILYDERRRSLEMQNRLESVLLELENERRVRQEYEHENVVLREEIRRAETHIADGDLKITKLQQEVTHVDTDNDNFRLEIHRLTDLYNVKLHDLENKYLIEIRELSAALERAKLDISQQRHDYEGGLKDLDRECNLKVTRVEERLREKERRVAELESELRKAADGASRLKIEYEEEIRRQVVLVREEEDHKYHLAARNLEVKIQNVVDERDLVVRKNQELVRDVHLLERQIQDYKMQFEAEIARLKNEIIDLRNQNSLLTATNEKQRNEIVNRDNVIARLESEIVNIEREIQRLKDIQVSEVNRLMNDHSNDRRRWEDTERILKARNAELERVIRTYENENNKLRLDIERLKEHVSGNVHRTIFQTFVEYETGQNPNIRPL